MCRCVRGDACLDLHRARSALDTELDLRERASQDLEGEPDVRVLGELGALRPEHARVNRRRSETHRSMLRAQPRAVTLKGSSLEVGTVDRPTII